MEIQINSLDYKLTSKPKCKFDQLSIVQTVEEAHDRWVKAPGELYETFVLGKKKS